MAFVNIHQDFRERNGIKSVPFVSMRKRDRRCIVFRISAAAMKVGGFNRGDRLAVEVDNERRRARLVHSEQGNLVTTNNMLTITCEAGSILPDEKPGLFSSPAVKQDDGLYFDLPPLPTASRIADAVGANGAAHS